MTALWFDPHNALLYFIYASVLGGLLTLAILQLRSAMLPTALYRVPWVAQLRAPKAGVPYGAAMAPAALIVFPDTALGGSRRLLKSPPLLICGGCGSTNRRGIVRGLCKR